MKENFNDSKEICCKVSHGLWVEFDGIFTRYQGKSNNLLCVWNNFIFAFVRIVMDGRKTTVLWHIENLYFCASIDTRESLNDGFNNVVEPNTKLTLKRFTNYSNATQIN